MKYSVSGDITVAFIHEVEADSEEEAEAKVAKLKARQMDITSGEHLTIDGIEPITDEEN